MPSSRCVIAAPSTSIERLAKSTLSAASSFLTTSTSVIPVAVAVSLRSTSGSTFSYVATFTSTTGTGRSPSVHRSVSHSPLGSCTLASSSLPPAENCTATVVAPGSKYPDSARVRLVSMLTHTSSTLVRTGTVVDVISKEPSGFATT